MAISELRADSFENEVLGPKIPVLVFFAAEDNEECASQERVLEELDKELSGKVKICKLDVNRQPIVALKYGIMDLPGIVVMDMGLFQKRLTGFQSRETLLECVGDFLEK
ncbi:MAG: thioredoxin domain-containing protein [Lachnospiraceae bacterium]|nr:thioredoxin domain-containing protein [Lachnospiraceae bacterium]MDD6505200.1 thioredoxin domain-containing protein [Lachnospiraceae bacterium]